MSRKKSKLELYIRYIRHILTYISDLQPSSSFRASKMPPKYVVFKLCNFHVFSEKKKSFGTIFSSSWRSLFFLSRFYIISLTILSVILTYWLQINDLIFPGKFFSRFFTIAITQLSDFPISHATFLAGKNYLMCSLLLYWFIVFSIYFSVFLFFSKNYFKF